MWRPNYPLLVLFGSFDVLHFGHREIIQQSYVLSKAFSNAPLQIVVRANYPNKIHLLSAEDRTSVILHWLEEQNLDAVVHTVPYFERSQWEKDCAKAIGKMLTDPQVLLITGIKAEDVSVQEQRNQRLQRNRSIYHEKKVCIVSNSGSGVFKSSSNIKRFLLSRANSIESFQEAIAHLVKTKEIDKYTAKLLPAYYVRLLKIMEHHG